MIKARRRIWVACIALLFVVSALCVVGFFAAHHGGSHPLTRKNQDTVTYTLSKPSEAPVNKANYVSAAVGDEPEYINLPTIGASGYVEKMGIDQYGEVAAPNSIHTAGWYVNSFKPGQAGLSIIDGHVDGWTSTGIFFRLAKLKAGDIFTVTLANGVAKQFQVKSVTTIPEAQAQVALFTRDNSIASQLNLITCGGTFSYQNGVYLGRTVVVAALVS